MTHDGNKAEDKILTTIQQEYKILAEYKMIEAEKIGGIYVIPSFGNSLLWYGVLFVRQGFYAEGVFRFNMLLPDKYPDDNTVPTVIFQNEIYHPLICPFTGTMDLSHAFPQWRCGEDHIWQLLKYMQYIFNEPLDCVRLTNITKWLNSEAFELISQNRAGFITKVKDCVNCSKEHVYDKPPTDDPHYITFDEYNEEVHGPIKQRIREGKDPMPGSTATGPKGLSWVKPGEFTPLSLE
ncbi:protein crossbronx [Glossina fuscipes]|uniref:Protein crossbronx n=1 Tax=Glossina fuscipes TaxID=7396 RepID=A0A9C6DQX1_9MUSC|nr:protein crossbronx [Glossina fuscipes]